MSGLRWEPQKDGTFYAVSGDVVIGMVVRRFDGLIVYSVEAVHTRWIAKGHGEVKSIASAKRAVEKAWATWLHRAGLAPIETSRERGIAAQRPSE